MYIYIYMTHQSAHPCSPYMKNSTVSGNKFLCCTHTDTIERARAHTHALTAEDAQPPPGGSTQIGCQMLQTAALITAFYEYITFYVHPNTDLFPFAQNQRGHTFPRTLRKKKKKKKSTNKLDWQKIEIKSLEVRAAGCSDKYVPSEKLHISTGNSSECADVCGYTFLSCCRDGL